MDRYINAYERSIIDIENKLNHMGEMVTSHFSQAIQAFMERDEQTAKEVIARDNEIDTLDEDIEMEALNIISLQQPVDYDLRLLNAAMRISRELERISDYACDIAEALSYLNLEKPFFKPLGDMKRMTELVREMLKRSLNAHFKRDLGTARKMDDDDFAVDNIFNSLIQELIDCMKSKPGVVEQASVLILVVRYLERVGDHVVNISEMTIFVETGERHPFKKDRNGLTVPGDICIQ